MMIWRCDNCGHEAKKDCIVGQEFEYLEHGFGSLAVPVDRKRDLCKSCMAMAQKAFSRKSEERTLSAWDRVKEAFKRAA